MFLSLFINKEYFSREIAFTISRISFINAILQLYNSNYVDDLLLHLSTEITTFLPVCPYICIKLLEFSIREKTLLSYRVSDVSCLFHSDNATRDRTIAVIAVWWTRRSTIVFAEQSKASIHTIRKHGIE